jgi:hypothetical protein
MRARPAGPAQSSALHNSAPEWADEGSPSTALDIPDEHPHSEVGKSACGAMSNPRNDRLLPLRGQHSQKRPLTWVLEPEEGFEPSTLRLRVGPKSFHWTGPDPSWLRRSGTDSPQTRPVPVGSNACKEVATVLRCGELASTRHPNLPISIGSSQSGGDAASDGRPRSVPNPQASMKTRSSGRWSNRAVWPSTRVLCPDAPVLVCLA